MFLALPPPAPGTSSSTGIAGDKEAAMISYTHFLLGVTPGLGKGVAALGIYDDANRTFSNTTGPPLGARVSWGERCFRG